VIYPKTASAYPPGYKPEAKKEAAKSAAPAQQTPNKASIQQPGGGFGIAAQAADNQTNDPYSSYTQSVGSDQIWQALQTEAGRIAIGAQMAIPIRTQLDYMGVARRFFEIDVLAQGQIAR
jgi:hypothetical protein